MKEKCQKLIVKDFSNMKMCKNYGFVRIENIVYCYVHFKNKKGGTCPTSG